jgi:hypothetical protein
MSDSRRLSARGDPRLAALPARLGQPLRSHIRHRRTHRGEVPLVAPASGLIRGSSSPRSAASVNTGYWLRGGQWGPCVDPVRASSGPKSSRKTPLAIGLGIRACQAGHRVLFATASEWVARLADAHHAGRLQTELVRLGRYPLGHRPKPNLELCRPGARGWVGDPCRRWAARGRGLSEARHSDMTGGPHWP